MCIRYRATEEVSPQLEEGDGRQHEGPRIKKKIMWKRLPISTVYDVDCALFDVDKIHKHPQLNSLSQWDYDIFSLARTWPSTVLSSMCFRILKDTGLISSFGLLEKELILYLHVLESGYRDVPYHNRVHAADVLHGVYYLCTQPVAGLEGSPQPGSASTAGLPVVTSLKAKRLPMLTKGANKCAHSEMSSGRSYGIVAANLTRLELLAVLLAAAMHDYDHPGRTNKFLVYSQSPLAKLYNNRSVLEQHHVSKSWEIMTTYTGCDFLKNMRPSERLKLQQLTVDCVLATDLDRHSIVLDTFNQQVNAGLDWRLEEHRLSVLLMIIKLADVSGPCKRFDLHHTWMNLLCEEFFQQGDEERSRGMDVTQHMDSQNPDTAKLQSKFIRSIVKPLVTAYNDAGLMPSEYEYPPPPSLAPNSVDDKSGGIVGLSPARRDGGEKIRLRKHCLPLKHLQDNLNYWTNVLDRETGSN